MNTSTPTLLQDLSSYAEMPEGLLQYLELKFGDSTHQSENNVYQKRTEIA